MSIDRYPGLQSDIKKWYRAVHVTDWGKCLLLKQGVGAFCPSWCSENLLPSKNKKQSCLIEEP